MEDNDNKDMQNKHIPKVSIGMPVYNGEKFIRKALDSLLTQTFTDFELIISDNASTDATAEICKEYAAKDARIRYVHHSINRGSVWNFNFVLKEACEEFFMWAAADDQWGNEWICSLLNKLQMSKADAVFGRIIQVNEASQFVDHPANYRSFRFAGSRVARRFLYFFQFECLGKANPFYSLYRKSVLADLLFDCNSKNVPTDCMFLYDLLNKTSIEAVSDVYLYKRLRSCCVGSRAAIKQESRTFLQRATKAVLFPIYSVQTDWAYFKISRPFEKFIILLAVPLKICFRYYYLVVLAIRRNSSFTLTRKPNTLTI